MSLIDVQASQLDKPNRITDVKDVEYHVRWSKFALATSAYGPYSQFISKTKINKLFYRGKQWEIPEDVETFLKDDTNQSRNRIKVVNNVIRPMVEQFRGNANRLQLNASLKSISQRSITRKEMALREQMFNFDLAFEVPEFAELMKEKFNLGETAGQTEEIFINHYRDAYVHEMNKLMDYIEDYNKLQDMQIKCAEDLALSGLVVVEGFEHGGHIVYENVEPEEFFFDNSAKKYDLSDSDFMGRAHFMLPTNIYERHQPASKDVEAIERYVSIMAGANPSNIFAQYASGGSVSRETTYSDGGVKVPVYRVFWRDTERLEKGYVMSEFGEPKLVNVNYRGVNNDQEPEYTDADLVEPPTNKRNKRIFKGKKKTFLYNDILRYCIFIPSEVLANAETNPSKKKEVRDIVLDYGIYEWQEVELDSPSNVKFPFKCQTWGYVDGEILSPVDDAISPQRFINRILSAAESQINMSGGSGPVFDMDTVDPQDAMDGTLDRNIKQGKAVTIRTKGRGVPNSIGSYDNTPSAGTYKMFELIPLMRDIIQSSTGVNEPLQGQSTGSDQLVGVTELLIQRGSLMQEPFYKALERLFVDIHQMSATVGKKIYIENGLNLVVAVGNSGAEVIKLSGDMLNEHFRAFVKRDNTDATLQQQADQQLMTFLQLGLIDETVFANLYGRSKPDDVLNGLRQFVAVKKLAQRKAEQEQAAAQEEMMIQQEADMQVADQMQREQRQQDADLEREKMSTKANAEIDKAIINKLGDINKAGNMQ